ncbi:hypothetical protein BDV98DRAFT_586191 [Pterulicium gracile]|uniref:Uncharacterized protein n=1 Tax=Pterulicium gracile TaxID=1884261 RepID=A0A5C3Q8M7_9AGAR|nr:hypothetical protein BDV98DRAFT_586191 [Pterula gracilis]
MERLQLPTLTDLRITCRKIPKASPVIALLTASSAVLRNFKICVDKARSLYDVYLLLECFVQLEHWSSLEELAIRTYGAGYRRGSDYSSMASDRIIGFLTRHPLTDDIVVDVFPRLRTLDLQLHAPAVSNVLDMLESRRGSGRLQIGSRLLTQCRLTNTISEYHRRGKDYIQERAARLAAHNIVSSEHNILVQMDWNNIISPCSLLYHTVGVRRAMKESSYKLRAYGVGYRELENPRLSWGECLAHWKPEELARLEKLEEGGLELWTKHSYCDEDDDIDEDDD